MRPKMSVLTTFFYIFLKFFSRGHHHFIQKESLSRSYFMLQPMKNYYDDNKCVFFKDSVTRFVTLFVHDSNSIGPHLTDWAALTVEENGSICKTVYKYSSIVNLIFYLKQKNYIFYLDCHGKICPLQKKSSYFKMYTVQLYTYSVE